MRLFTVSGAALVFASAAVAKEMAKDEVRAKAFYDNGLTHQQHLKNKVDNWMAAANAGLFSSEKWPRLNYTKCIDGKVEAVKGDPLHTFKCKNIDLYDFINHATLGSPNGWDEAGDGLLLTGSGSWGWTDPESGREFIASGMYDGTALLEILPEGRLLHLAFLPSPVDPNDRYSFWKELRSYKHYMIIGSERRGHGVQIFDMRKLLTVDPAKAPVKFDGLADLTGHFMEMPLGASHNVVVNEEKEYMVAVGSAPRTDVECQAGLIFVDLKDPSKPKKIACNGDDGYVHDAQCLPYKGPDTRYQGRDICYGYNEDSLTIYDVTDKAKSTIISVTSYQGVQYSHQGVVLDPNNQEFLLLDDELDEIRSSGMAMDKYPVTYIWDIRDLEHPKQTGLYKGTVPAVDHNQYVMGNGLVYQSNYMAGYRVYDISSIPTDPTGSSVCEVAYLDIHPEDDAAPGGGVADMFGTWSSYAKFPSGFIYINTIERGGYLAKMTRRESCPRAASCNADNCLRAMRSTSVAGRLEESQKFCGEFTKTFIADVSVVPDYASKACGANVISRVSSACSCLPTPTP
ncbi:hypothetical protein RB596_006097 [Gaeumannomyces avenae]